MARLEDISKGAQVSGLTPEGVATVISVDFTGDNAINVIYESEAGEINRRLLFRSDEPNLHVHEKGVKWSFDAEPADFKLGTEAFRIHLAHLFDPLLAVHTSTVEPLPHQITAVYEAMLPRQPLRFLLADDPGSGKTIMAGLLIRELMIRGDVKRCLVVAPGSLVEQWQDELDQKFNLIFDIFSREQVELSHSGNPFEEKDLLVARVDQLARGDDLLEKLGQTDWDLVVVDEAHKMSASYYGSKFNETKRYRLGKILGSLTRHLLLMTATPHNGKEEDFQAFMALLDSDRFYGKYRDGTHQVEVSDLMRRMVKEELLRFDGTRLFPERFAYTRNYELSPAEAALYAHVTQYVVNEMNRAQALDDKRKGNVGFALTSLQRRLASSPEAIYQSLVRRHKKLSEMLSEAKLMKRGLSELGNLQAMPEDEWPEIEDEYNDEELENLRNDFIDLATAARTVEELERETESLRLLVDEARAVRTSGHDRKWRELSELLQNTPEMFEEDGATRRKLIIFTEHRDTLNYLYDRIVSLIGQDEAVLVIHGGVKREERRKVQELFTQSREAQILLATDAAGEGVNLQRANLMINYDLPWNPNRIEQRFGRIHRIGQTEVCYLWNLVARETREGLVFYRLLEKLEVESHRLQGKVFDILGQAIDDRTLKDLLLEAIRYGESEEVQKRLSEKIECALDPEHLDQVIRERALAAETFSAERVFRIREEMERAQARRLQPHYIFSFFRQAFGLFDGELKEREKGRFEITYVPQVIRQRDRQIGSGAPVLRKYERLCCEKERVRVPGKPLASLLAPGHALMDATIDLMLERFRPELKKGAILIDPEDDGDRPRLLFILDHAIEDGTRNTNGRNRVVSRRMQFVYLDPKGRMSDGGHAPYLDLRAPEAAEMGLAQSLLEEEWLKADFEGRVLQFAAEKIIPDHLRQVRERRNSQIEATERAVHERLTKEINHWSGLYAKFQSEVQAGKQPRMQPENARRRAEELTARLEQRTRDLNAQRNIASTPARVIGGALVVPQGWLVRRRGDDTTEWTHDQAARKEIERRAMQAVMEAERALGFEPVDVSRANAGYDIESHADKGILRFIEVKGRRADARTVSVSRNEILTALNEQDDYILAIVRVDGDRQDGPHYLPRPFERAPDFGVESSQYNIAELLKRARPPAEWIERP